MSSTGNFIAPVSQNQDYLNVKQVNQIYSAPNKAEETISSFKSMLQNKISGKISKNASAVSNAGSENAETTAGSNLENELYAAVQSAVADFQGNEDNASVSDVLKKLGILIENAFQNNQNTDYRAAMMMMADIIAAIMNSVETQNQTDAQIDKNVIFGIGKTSKSSEIIQDSEQNALQFGMFTSKRENSNRNISQNGKKNDELAFKPLITQAENPDGQEQKIPFSLQDTTTNSDILNNDLIQAESFEAKLSVPNESVNNSYIDDVQQSAYNISSDNFEDYVNYDTEENPYPAVNNVNNTGQNAKTTADSVELQAVKTIEASLSPEVLQILEKAGYNFSNNNKTLVSQTKVSEYQTDAAAQTLFNDMLEIASDEFGLKPFESQPEKPFYEYPGDLQKELPKGLLKKITKELSDDLPKDLKEEIIAAISKNPLNLNNLKAKPDEMTELLASFRGNLKGSPKNENNKAEEKLNPNYLGAESKLFNGSTIDTQLISDNFKQIFDNAPIPVPNQIADGIKAKLNTLQSGETEFQLELNPESLGKVSIKLVTESGRVAVEIIAERPETRALLQSRAEQMGQTLRQNGVELERYVVYQEQGQETYYNQDGKQQREKQENHQPHSFEENEKDESGLSFSELLQAF